MSMDGLSLHAVIRELECLQDGKIDKVQQPEKDLLLLTVRTRNGNRKLLVSVHAESGRMQLTDSVFDNPPQAPAFCMLLRRRLTGGRITSVAQRGMDRICTVQIHARNELQDDVDLSLVLELTGKHSNIILTDSDGIILEALRRVSASATSTRILMPGFSYEYPPEQSKCNPLTAPAEAFDALFENGAPTARSMTERFSGLSRSAADALLCAFPSSALLQAQFSRFRSGMFSPTVCYDADHVPVCVLPLAAEGTGITREAFPTMSLALDRYYRDLDAALLLRRHGSDLRRSVEHALSRCTNKHRAFVEAIENESQLETWRLYGELILNHLREIHPGQTVLSAVNYYLDPPGILEIPLDPALSPTANSARYYKQYRKGRLSRDYAESRLKDLETEMEYLESVLASIETCESLAELEEIRQELIAQKVVKPEGKREKRLFANPSRPMSFRSSDGTEILVGKNNRQNDELTLHADGEYTWLHAKNMPGSHVIIATREEPSRETLYEAAILAAIFSSGKTGANIPVDYTRRKFVRKPSGAKPGKVIYSTNRTVTCDPDRNVLNRLTRDQK
jgi:predicted ribosome quality control (RQC) complex YloA/Tae2 family protein